MRDIVLIAHDIRSTHNVGSLLRTAEGLGAARVWLTGYTPYPAAPDDDRLPHLAQKIDAQIRKTALGAEATQPWNHADDIDEVLDKLTTEGYVLAALEQTNQAVHLPYFKPPDKLAILLGREVDGISPELLKRCSVHLEIPMFGQKESFNVVQAAAICLYHCRFA